MKQKALPLLLFLALAGSLTAPAFGWEPPPGGDGTVPQDLELYQTQEEAGAQALAEKYPEEYAAFDAEAWLMGIEDGLTVAQYMAARGQKTYEQFRRFLFCQWASREKGFYNGYCVMIDGVPNRLQANPDENGEAAAPKAENGRILLPLRAAAEAMGLAVEWEPETNKITCSKETIAVTFILDSTAYSGGTLEAAPFAEKGVAYLPLRALGEALGCEVSWNQDFSTAALTTPYDRVDYDTPLWRREMGPGGSLEAFINARGLKNEREYYEYVAQNMALEAYYQACREDYVAWLAKFQEQHAQEIAQFDSDVYFVTDYPCKDCYDGGKEEYLTTWDYTEEDFQTSMKERWIRDQYEPDPGLEERYAALDKSLTVPGPAEADRQNWERFLKKEPHWAQAFLTDMEHPEREILVSGARYRTVQEYQAVNPDKTLEEAYWGVYYDNWSASRLHAMENYWAFRGEHPGWCDEVALTVDDKPVYIPYGYTAICIEGEVYVNARALSNALGEPVERDEYGFAPLPGAVEEFGWSVSWDPEQKSMRITTEKD